MILLLVLLAGVLVGAAATAILLDSEWWTGGPKDPAWWIDPDEPEPYAATIPRLLPGEDSRSECEYCSHGEHYPDPCRASVPWGPGDSRPCDCLDVDPRPVRTITSPPGVPLLHVDPSQRGGITTPPTLDLDRLTPEQIQADDEQIDRLRRAWGYGDPPGDPGGRSSG